MTHLPVLPVLVPMAAAAALLLGRNAALGMRRALSALALAAGLGVSLGLAIACADGTVIPYALGGWRAPYGIVLVADRLSAALVVLLFTLALIALAAALAQELDTRGRHFHPLFQLQVAGIAGAFLTGDVFNLFVFFEILLIASYALLVHGGGRPAVEAALPYVVLNLVGSALFLVALGLLYGTLGTLNLADIADILPDVPPQDLGLVRVALVSLAVVFLLKAAVVPMGFWLPHTYAAAAAPVAVLFALLTKVGIVALLRLSAVALPATPAGQGLLTPWLPALGLLTIIVGVLTALAARRLAQVAAGFVLVSSGTLAFAVADGRADATAALLFYLPHSTLATAGLFLLAGAVALARGDLADRLVRGPAMAGAGPLGVAFVLLAVAAAGLPPLAGFLGKLMLLEGAGQGGWRWAWWALLLLSGLAGALVLARAGSVLFWEPREPAPPGRALPRLGAPLGVLAVASPLLTLAAAPAAAWARATAEQLHDPATYVSAVLGREEGVVRERRPG
ncbi:MAG: monovalent cation/H+ antiporter subunit D [Sphingomonadaceae bacterium]|uniref:monovalent cation/H+ antiporter subunit D n=1 Tax=Thermaurantiacus sp. TaxID=2820283 RepID=UPI00298F1B09|nr:monovalent cation/H+ antiporter subunit D [Thermaurantiacus sp.]MCS6987617.1 monovalent cation/H+ antiporter subunit D [Sphingomonadaceae bacterium]MDW8415218.1 monovalent cation/H+ antiporter subunit D [Thermaurantiacus sp.]